MSAQGTVIKTSPPSLKNRLIFRSLFLIPVAIIALVVFILMNSDGGGNINRSLLLNTVTERAEGQYGNVDNVECRTDSGDEIPSSVRVSVGKEFICTITSGDSQITTTAHVTYLSKEVRLRNAERNSYIDDISVALYDN